ncbi:hypothetical protein HYY75_05390 [bacterium]|nr:hypothetical protein [bacterium]
MVDPWKGRKGIDILVDILWHVEPSNQYRLLKNLQVSAPQIAAELQKRLFTFDHLSEGDNRGVQRLLKRIPMRDLAMALKGASEEILKRFAGNMSQRSLQELREEIMNLGPSRLSDIENARNRIVSIARDLVGKKELFIGNSGKDAWVE